MTVKQIMSQLKKMGSASTRKTLMRHGAPESIYGVKIGDMKTILKKTKTDHGLARELWETGNSDARYLAALMADENVVTKTELTRWMRESDWTMLREAGVAALAAESKHGASLAEKWIGAKDEGVAAAGWSAMSGIISTRDDSELDLGQIRSLLTTVEKTIHGERNRVKHKMNGFVICVGCYIPKLHDRALKAAKKIGVVDVDQGDTGCKEPLATEYIAKVKKMGRIGKKRKAVRC